MNFAFFEKYIDKSKPVLVGLSGGPDSTYLLHMLMKWNKVEIHIVHVDHGWRDESQRECELLKQNAKGLAFHDTRLDPSRYTGNKEAKSRQERYQFFKEVADKVGASAILLGHHADDVTETVFKRMLEGASLIRLAGLVPVRTIDGLLIMRPLLGVTKAEITAWLDKEGISYFIDSTNEDTRYLRSNLRQNIFPYIRTHFGKAFTSSLYAIGQESIELKAFLDEQVKEYYEAAITGPWGVFCEKLPDSHYLRKHLFRTICDKLQITLSRTQLELAVHLVAQANKQVHSGSGTIYLDRSRAFFMPKREFLWEMTITEVEKPAKVYNHFSDAWQGSLCTYLPIQDYTLIQSEPKMRHIVNKEYGAYLTEKKIPHFLAAKVPILSKDGTIVEDFLTGTIPKVSTGPCYRIRLNLEPKCSLKRSSA